MTLYQVLFFCTLSNDYQYTVGDKGMDMDYLCEGVKKENRTHCKHALYRLWYFKAKNRCKCKMCALQCGLHFLSSLNDYHIFSLPPQDILTFTLAHLPENVTSLWISQQVKCLRSRGAQKEKIPHQFQNVFT